ncbi:LysE family transporter [Muricauda sp. MAR_2010_75]|uniref:LysE family transporter n=1 Tax=Allomuricauda sp. MAR_2010_75 TaxID=1250232 RepID=UPI0018CFB7E0|nr:LysE family transporter [Muricauda sp. MAR_2010_75]
MQNYIKVCFSGLLISFLGALPLGTLNLTAFDIAASQDLVSALWFSVAVVLVELIVVRLTLFGNERLQLSDKLMIYLLPLGILLLLYLSITSFVDAASVSKASSKVNLLPQLQSTFVLGLLLSALNPLQIPFWMTWNKVLEKKDVLTASKSSYTFYLVGIGLGTMLGLAIFMLLGNSVFTNYGNYGLITNLLMGVLYLGFSFYLMFIFFKQRPNYKTP